MLPATLLNHWIPVRSWPIFSMPWLGDDESVTVQIALMGSGRVYLLPINIGIFFMKKCIIVRLLPAKCLTGSNIIAVKELSWSSHLAVAVSPGQESRVGNSVPAWSVSLWLLLRVRFDFCDSIDEAKTNAQIRGDNFKVKFVLYR